jgi:hypothetical protein
VTWTDSSLRKNKEMIDSVWLGQKLRSTRDKTRGKNSLTFQEKKIWSKQGWFDYFFKKIWGRNKK